MKIRMVKVKAGQRKLRERIKDALAKKGARASILINKLAANKKAVIWKPAELDAIALELRHLAFQIRVLKNAKTATEGNVADGVYGPGTTAAVAKFQKDHGLEPTGIADV
ncbi:MAG: peptidoglycan-binding protein, partial [Kiritimatiellae bacterium]|nr:peptidoglycan-binding protein [Kiritimatiellia bacterium]